MTRRPPPLTLRTPTTAATPTPDTAATADMSTAVSTRAKAKRAIPTGARAMEAMPATGPTVATAAAMAAIPATEAQAALHGLFDADRLLTCVSCLKRLQGPPSDLPDRLVGAHTAAPSSTTGSVDEVVGLAAGQRPCAICRPDAAFAFAAAWARANGRDTPPSFDEIDAMLSHEGLGRDADDRPPWVAFVDTLPDGAMFIDGAVSTEPQAVRGATMVPWSRDGWGEPVPRSRRRLVTLVTPPSTVMALAAGYRPTWSAPDDDAHQDG